MKKQIFSVTALFLAGIAPAAAQSISSVYTKLDVGETCTEIDANEIGASFACDGHPGYGFLLDEYDLRTSIFYGYVGDWYGEGAWESFQSFNGVNDTIEWRLHDGVPRATILRWFIDNPDPNTGAPSEQTRGQVLVVSKVAQPGEGEGCVVAYVDARVNSDANALAREAADQLYATFQCRVDEPAFIGERGPYAGVPSRAFGP
ncbi:MAG: hypothetical protein AAF940_06370 [Pseudomonadota bacterium]